jgi:succinate dehydrogenase / fumarate reductase iron-sulfur subunit
MNITLRISRFIPGHIDPPRFETHEIDVSETATVLAVLERIRLERDSSLMYRRSCHHSACGTCALKVNGLESLACITEIASLNTSEIRLEPLDGFERLGDLVVDIAPLFDHFSEQWGSLRPISKQPDHSDAEKEDSRMRFEDCIECAACVSACPVSESANTFKGPAALAALEREIEKHPGSKSDLLKLAAGRDGAKGCRRALLCSRVCPTGVYPARSIYDLLKLLDR